MRGNLQRNKQVQEKELEMKCIWPYCTAGLVEAIYKLRLITLIRVNKRNGNKSIE